MASSSCSKPRCQARELQAALRSRVMRVRSDDAISMMNAIKACCVADGADVQKRWGRLRCAPLVPVMKATNFRNRHDSPCGYFRDRSMIWRVLRESQVRATSMIVLAVAREDAPQMRLVENDHVIETLSAQRADQALDVRILPGTRRGRDDLSDAHTRQSPPQDVAVDVVPISMQPAGRGVVREGFDHMLSGPRGCRMLRDVEMHDAPTVMRQHDQDEQHSASECRNGEEIHRRGGREVICEKRPPCLEGRTCVRFQQTRHRAFRHIDAERAELTVNPWRSPQRICGRHVSSEGADLLIDQWTAVWPTFRASGPSTAKPVAMPAHDGVRLHEHQRNTPVPPASRQGDPKQSVARLEMGSRGRASQGRQLLPQGQVLQDQLSMSTARQCQRTDQYEQQLQHASIVAGAAARFNKDEFWRGSGPVREILQEAGIRFVQTPFRAPNANAHAERFVRSIKEECLDRIIPLGERHLRRAVHEFVQHYHLERNHQGLENALIDGVSARTVGAIRRRPRLGGLLNYYERAA